MGKQQKSKAIAFTFRPFLATFSIFHQWIKNSKKVKGIALLFCCFLAISKVAKNGDGYDFFASVPDGVSIQHAFSLTNLVLVVVLVVKSKAPY